MYYLVNGFLYLLSLLPLRALYVLSDFATFVLYRIVGYRNEVVLKNLAIAFPERSEQERERIAARFYKNFMDTFIETIKFISAGPEFMKKHFKADVSVFEQLHAEGKSCQIHLGHNFNWELAALTVPLLVQYKVLIVYMPINNKPIDRIFKNLRAKTGADLLPATQMRTAILPYRNRQYLLALVADQNPGVPGRAYWVDFFGRPTPFVKGPEKGARTNDTAVVFAHFTKERRGYYTGYFELATREPNQLAETELTAIYIRFLERVIRAHPEMWLWSHRRWKHEWKPEYGPVIQQK